VFSVRVIHHWRSQKSRFSQRHVDTDATNKQPASRVVSRTDAYGREAGRACRLPRRPCRFCWEGLRLSDGESDAALARRVRSGDIDAFGVFVERYKRQLYAHALGIVRSREDALDLSQEAFIRAYRARRSFDPEQPFGAWLYQILRRLCFNYLRDAKTRARLLNAHGAWLVDASRSVHSDPAREAERAETCRRVAAAIDALPPHEREVLVLKEFEELKYREIAERLQIPLGTVMSRLYAARKRLVKALEEDR
jgi:RNA polymerase sigma-70 factor (ECF subfamily)